MAAKTMKDVEQHDAVQRLRESLEYSYGQQIDESNKAYDKAFSQAGNEMQKRGLGRSSLAIQTQANILNQKNQAANRLGEAMIADFQKGIGQVEQQEKENEFRERQYADQRADTAWQQAFSQNQADIQNQQWRLNYALQKASNEWNQKFQQQRAEAGDKQWEMGFNAQQNQNAWQQGFSEKQFNAQQDQNAWQQNMSERQFAAQQDQNAIENAFREKQFSSQQDQNAIENAFREKQFSSQQDQNAIENAFREKQFGAQQEQNAIENAFREKQFDANQSQNAIENAFREKQFSAQQEQQTIANQQWQQQFNAQQAQWREQFDYNALSDVQKSAFNVAVQAAALGNDVEDYLLGRAGLTRADFNSMKQQAAAGGYTPTPQNDGDGGSNPPPTDALFDAFLGDDKKTTGLNFSKVYK